ncbi:MAG TPA: SDR family NAD(P)-dependent oxidoreductase [Polyangiaceae bacterium]|jgi:NAD(P)-dependent dehydrogenase (short-subunit alcohol dehydrogenase family)
MPIAVLTGANRGLGLEAATELAKKGYRVWLTGRDAAHIEQAAAALRDEKLDVRASTLDVASSESVNAFAARMAKEPPIDALVNNAGSSLSGFNAEIAERTVDNNYRGAVRVTDALFERLAPNANIVMVSSGMGELGHLSTELAQRLLSKSLTRDEIEAVAAEFIAAVKRGNPSAAGFPSNAYCVSKALMNAFTRVFARELEGTGRRINSVCPGWVKTRMGGSSAPRSLAQGASGIIWAATLGASGPNGGFFRDAKPIAW